MLREEGTWDIRCPGSLFELREKLSKLPGGKPRPYYWKVDKVVAKQIVDILTKAYHVRKCAVMVGGGKLLKGLNGCYVAPRRSGERAVMYIHGRAHMKTVFHEFYHHLDWATDGLYDSDDHKGGPSSYGWQFADRMWNVLTAEYRPITMRTRVFNDSRGPYLVHADKRLRPLGKAKHYHPGTYVWADFKRVPTTTDYTATVRPLHLGSLPGPGDAASDVWSSLQSQIAASKPPPGAKKAKLPKESKAAAKRRLKARRQLAGGLMPDPRDLGITCGECERGAKFKYIDEVWRCGAHHKRRVKAVKEYFKTEVTVTRERLEKLDAFVAKSEKLTADLTARKLSSEQGIKELGRLAHEGSKLGCDMTKVKSGIERILKTLSKEEVMATKSAKSTAKSTVAKTTTKATSKKAASPTRSGKDWRAVELKDNAKITIKVKECPYKGKRAARWVYRTGMTVVAAVEKGASRSDIKWDTAHDYIAVR